MPLGPHELLFVIVIPALAALMILLLARRVWLRRDVEGGGFGLRDARAQRQYRRAAESANPTAAA